MLNGHTVRRDVRWRFVVLLLASLSPGAVRADCPHLVRAGDPADIEKKWGNYPFNDAGTGLVNGPGDVDQIEHTIENLKKVFGKQYIVTVKYTGLLTEAFNHPGGESWKGLVWLISYTGNYYNWINDYLRGAALGQPGYVPPLGPNCAEAAEAVRLARRALGLVLQDDAVMEKASHAPGKLTKSTQRALEADINQAGILTNLPSLYRGVNWIDPFRVYFENNILKAPLRWSVDPRNAPRAMLIFEEPAFASAAVGMIPHNYRRTNVRFVVNNAANRGRRIEELSVMNINLATTKQKSDERELLFPPGQKFLVTNILVEQLRLPMPPGGYADQDLIPLLTEPKEGPTSKKRVPTSAPVWQDHRAVLADSVVRQMLADIHRYDPTQPEDTEANYLAYDNPSRIWWIFVDAL
jgi:hypothetical protein